VKITIYRYPHPTEQGRWIYTGQTANIKHRDTEHRKGSRGFGLRFKKLFHTELPQPNFQEIEVANQLEANEEETIAIFRNHTWHGQGGMNLSLPGSCDYKQIGLIGAIVAGQVNVKSGWAFELGRLAVITPGHLSKAGRIGGQTTGLRNAKHKIGIFAPTFDLSKAGIKGGKATNATTNGRKGNGGRIGGVIGGNKQVTNRIGIFSPEMRGVGGRVGGKIGGRVATHNRWHVQRNIINPNCELCTSLPKAA